MSLETERVCKVCKKVRSIESFPFCSSSKRQKRRRVCHECNYGNRVHFHESSSKEDVLENLKRRLMSKVEKTEGCWGWNGFIRPDGYTRITYGARGKSIGGHVASWMIHNKQVEVPKLNVLHSCDVRHCVNPKHLFLGTYSDNMIDMVLKKRHPGIKLTVAQVRIIKEKLNDGVTCARLSRDFNVHWVTIDDIKKERTWKHVASPGIDDK